MAFQGPDIDAADLLEALELARTERHLDRRGAGGIDAEPIARVRHQNIVLKLAPSERRQRQVTSRSSKLPRWRSITVSTTSPVGSIMYIVVPVGGVPSVLPVVIAVE